MVFTTLGPLLSFSCLRASPRNNYHARATLTPLGSTFRGSDPFVGLASISRAFLLRFSLRERGISS
jgi:hypothetical protein